MATCFAVVRSRGPAWNASLPLEQQDDWRLHADFMTTLHARASCSWAGRWKAPPTSS
jgi:hypothetical protein